MLMKDIPKDWTVDHEEDVKEFGLFDSVLENIMNELWMNHNEKICIKPFFLMTNKHIPPHSFFNVYFTFSFYVVLLNAMYFI